MSDNKFQLINKVINASEAEVWLSAVEEWEIIDCELDYEQDSQCICGKERIKYLYTIKNIYNNNLLYPIGSNCIKKFERMDLKDITNIYEQKYKLLNEFETNGYIEFSSKLFSKKLLKHLYEDDCFVPNKYNDYNPYKDYEFLLDMFNKRSPLTSRQESKVKAIIMNSIRPYLEETLKKKNED
ncbi:hypothetical protein ACWOBX_00775 [Facklamia languida]